MLFDGARLPSGLLRDELERIKQPIMETCFTKVSYGFLRSPVDSGERPNHIWMCVVVFQYVGSALVQKGVASIADTQTFRNGFEGNGFGQLCSIIPAEMQLLDTRQDTKYFNALSDAEH